MQNALILVKLIVLASYSSLPFFSDFEIIFYSSIIFVRTFV